MLTVKTVSVYISHHGTSLGLLAETLCALSRVNNRTVISTNPSSCAHDFKQRRHFFYLESHWESEQHQNCLWDAVLQHLCPSTCWLIEVLEFKSGSSLKAMQVWTGYQSFLEYSVWYIIPPPPLWRQISWPVCASVSPFNAFPSTFWGDSFERRKKKKVFSIPQPIRWRRCGNSLTSSLSIFP